MLSHHELAALLLIRDARQPVMALDSDLLALRRYQLIEMDEHGPDTVSLHLTEQGRDLLRRLFSDEPPV
jgi:hypothetical protein